MSALGSGISPSTRQAVGHEGFLVKCTEAESQGLSCGLRYKNLLWLILAPLGGAWILVPATVIAVRWIQEGFRPGDKAIHPDATPLELGEFITQSLFAIFHGLDQANQRVIAEGQTPESLFFLRYSPDKSTGSAIEFDVGVIAMADTTSYAKAAFKVAVFEGALGQASATSRGAVSRMKFIVYAKHWDGLNGPRSAERKNV
ncbi:MAG: hypothetical protein HY067_02235 [Betaproteobacteria bacterium]|nr:hypothetical protein [Betaproteobacteria bacterium]